jgi:hypothetical protein
MTIPTIYGALALLKAAFAPTDSLGAGVGQAQSPRIRGTVANGLGQTPFPGRQGLLLGLSVLKQAWTFRHVENIPSHPW